LPRIAVNLLLALLLIGWTAPLRADPTDLGKSSIIDQNWIIDGTLDERYRTASTGRTDQVYTNDLELDVQHPITLHDIRQGTVFLQEMLETPPDEPGPSRTALRLGEAYASYRLPILTETDSTAYIKVGQFPIAAGLTAVYDTHLQIMQNLYDEGLGVRVDSGVGVDGRFYGVLDYKASATTGVGPDRYSSGPRVVAFRLGHLFATDVGAFNVGGSLLAGELPVTTINPNTFYSPSLPSSGYVNPTYGYVQKSRMIGDGQWTYKGYTLRGEAMSGADGDNSVYGYYLDGEYRFAPGLTAVASRKFWDYGIGNSTSSDNAGGINIDYGNNFSIRGLYEERLDTPNNAQPFKSQLRHLFTIQALARF
jgi:hypothetical protein